MERRHSGKAMAVALAGALMLGCVGGMAATTGQGSAQAEQTSAQESQATQQDGGSAQAADSSGVALEVMSPSNAMRQAEESGTDSSADASGEPAADADATAADTDDSATEESLAAAREAYAKATPQASGTCMECHTSQDMLEASKSSEDIDVTLYLVDEEYATSLHGLLGCTYCHGGDATATDAATAMEGMAVYPSADGGVSVCGQCHADEVADYATSLHNTTAGLECAYAKRLATASENAGEDLAAVNYRSAGCPDCHAECGECHVRNAAQSQFGKEDTGLIKGHMFVDGTDNDDISGTCLSCHAGSIAGCYQNYDVHGMSGANMNCMDCHSVSEIHGDGTERSTMAHSGAIKVECQDCHSTDTLTGEWHSSTHLESAECWSCHSVAYNTCRSCHGWNASSRGDNAFDMDEELMLGYDTANGKITTLTKAPVDAGMLGDAGTELNDADLNNGSTFYPGFTHGIVVPEVSQELCDRCHGEGTALIDADDLQYPDYESDQVVDPLPAVDVTDYADSAADK